MNDDILQQAFDGGFAFEKKYHGCAQCVIGPVYELFPELYNEDIFRSASALAGGTGLSTHGQCGALSGAVMIIGQLCGRELGNLEDPGGTRFRAHKLAEKMVQRFLQEYGAVVCGEIQTKLMGRSFYLFDPEQFQAFEKAGGHNDKCPSVVGNATRWVVDIILAMKKAKK